MTKQFVPDVTFLLGPPTDPEFLARFEKAQKSPGTGDAEERCLELEPRVSALVATREGEPSHLSELFDAREQTETHVA